MPKKNLKMKNEVETVVSAVNSILPKKNLRITSQTLLIIVGILFLLSAGAGGYYYYRFTHTPEAIEARERKQVTTRIRELMNVPGDEDPTIATVSDKGKLEDKPFFQYAENGDKVVLYPKYGRAVLYRPSNKKIVDITTISVSSEQNASQAASGETQQP